MTRSALTDRLLELPAEEWLREIHRLTAAQRAEAVAELERRRVARRDHLGGYLLIVLGELIICGVAGWLAGWTSVITVATALGVVCAFVALSCVGVHWGQLLREQEVRDRIAATRGGASGHRQGRRTYDF